MKRFWGRGAIAMSALLAVVAFGSFLAGENLSRVSAAHAAAAATPAQPAPVAGAPPQQPWPGHGARRPHRGGGRQDFFPSGEIEEP